MKYSDKLKDVRWQKKRLDIMSRDKFSCRACYSHEGTMHVHHLRYLKRYDPWDYEDTDLITLCDDCHAEWHRLFDNNIQPGKTFLVAKLHFDLDIKAMQKNKMPSKNIIQSLNEFNNPHSQIIISRVDDSPVIEIKTVDEAEEYSSHYIFIDKKDAITFIESFKKIISNYK